MQCDALECQKWRRIDNVDDLDTVNEVKWVCSMNTGALFKKNSIYQFVSFKFKGKDTIYSRLSMLTSSFFDILLVETSLIAHC